MGEPKGYLVVPLGYNPDGRLRTFELDADDNLLVSLASILATVDVNIESQDVTLDVSLVGQVPDIDVNLTGQDVDIEVTQQTPADLLTGSHGYIGGSWQKNPILLGISDVGAEQVSALTVAGGGGYVYGTAVPSGEVWLVQTAVLICSTAAATRGLLIPEVNGIQVCLLEDPGAASGYYMTWVGQIALAPGDKMGGYVLTAASGNTIWLRYQYIRIDIDL